MRFESVCGFGDSAHSILGPNAKKDKCLHLSRTPKAAMVLHWAFYLSAHEPQKQRWYCIGLSTLAQRKSHPKHTFAPTVSHFGISLVVLVLGLCLALRGTLVALLRIGQESIGCCLAKRERH